MKAYNFPLLIFVFLTGCKLGPDYQIPPTDPPSQWKFSQEQNIEAPEVEHWWEIFDDPVLNALEEQAIETNRDLYASMQRIFQARAILGIRSADLYPQLNLKPNYYNVGTLIKVFGIPAPPPPSPPPVTILRVHQVNYSLPLDLSYEVDLWGKLRSQRMSALYNVEAKIMSLQTLLLVLTADLAHNYFDLRALDAQIELLKNTMAVRHDSLEINQERFRVGLINFSDVTRASTQFYNAEAEYIDALRKRTIKENIIASLMGLPPTDLEIAFNPLSKPPPLIPAGIPSEILLKRPDIIEAERTVASEQALIGAAYASFYPSLSLTGTLGYASPDLRDFLTWKSRLWAFGANIVEPIFNGGRNFANLDFTWARFREASDIYQQKVIVAFREVEDALVNIKYLEDQMKSLEESAKSAVDTTELSTDRYLQGFINYLDVVDSQRSELEIKTRITDLLARRYASTIQLIKALGGSWSMDCCE